MLCRQQQLMSNLSPLGEAFVNFNENRFCDADEIISVFTLAIIS